MKTNIYFLSLFAIFTVALLSVGTITPALAQNNGSTIKISPVIFDELNSNAGEKLSGVISVRNTGNENLTLYPEAQNFLPKEGNEDGMPEAIEEDTPYALSDWITFNMNKVELAPGEDENVKFFINIPSNANPGGHYGTMIFTTKASDGFPENTQLKVESGVGALILLRVNGDIKESAVIKDFSNSGIISSPTERKVDFELRFENTGNTHVKPTGTITITNWMGREIDQIPLESAYVLPESTRKMVTSWNITDRTFYGQYTATLEASYGESGENFSATTTFSDYHITTILIIIVTILLIVVFIKMSSKNYKEELHRETKEKKK